MCIANTVHTALKGRSSGFSHVITPFRLKLEAIMENVEMIRYSSRDSLRCKGSLLQASSTNKHGCDMAGELWLLLI
jgi:hypothetical protein